MEKKKEKKHGVLLIAFGKRGYGFAAANLACSIKRFQPDLHITLLATHHAINQLTDKHRMFFNVVGTLPEGINPSTAKTLLYDLSPYDKTLFLDVDGMALQSLAPIFERLDGTKVTCQQMGIGKKGEEIYYDAWGKHEDVWPFFGLKDDALWRTTQTSWVYFEKGTVAKKFFTELKKYQKKGFPLEKLKYSWAGYLPDELLYSGVATKMDLPLYAEKDIIFFGSELVPTSQVEANYFILSLYGNGTGRTLVRPSYFDFYDMKMLRHYESFGMEHYFKCYFIMQDKILTR